MLLFKSFVTAFLLATIVHWTVCLLPPKFQWKTINYAWEGDAEEEALRDGAFIPENCMPSGLARWKDKLFIAIPRWKVGVPVSLNYIYLNGTQDQLLHPYPSWKDGFVPHCACSVPSNSTVVSAFRVHVDKCDRLWVVDNGVSDMANDVKQIGEPAILVFNLKTNKLIHKYTFEDKDLRDVSVLTSIVVDMPSSDCYDAFAYVTDMGSNAVIVFSLKDHEAWRVEHPFFHFDPGAGVFRVGGIDFYWSDGVSSAALSSAKSHGYRDLYLQPTASTKQFKMSTKLLRNKTATGEEIFNGVEIIGDRGPRTQATACDMDQNSNVLFFTQLSKNGVGCWNTRTSFSTENTPILVSDCNVLEFPNDIKVDADSNVWILSNRQSRFLYQTLNESEVNFRILTAPASKLIEGTTCENKNAMCKAFSFMKRKKTG